MRRVLLAILLAATAVGCTQTPAQNAPVGVPASRETPCPTRSPMPTPNAQGGIPEREYCADPQ
jgi:hypothetical protein